MFVYTGPCGAGSSCLDVPGSYICNCPSGRTGGRCQFSNICNVSSQCPPGNFCIEVLSSLEGFVCMDEITNPREHLIISVSTVVGAQRLEEFVLAFVEAQAQNKVSTISEYWLTNNLIT